MTPIQLTKDMITETIYFGDCLELMKEWVQQNGGLNNLGIPNRPGLVDQIYLDPPFNSKTNYNILFAKETNKDIGHTAQETAFTDTWTWGEHAEKRVENIIQTTTHPASNAILGIKETLGECGMLSYLSFMADRLRYMNYLLKETGRLFLHCDHTASHYLKMIMDAIFGAKNFKNEIVWRRTGAHPLSIKKFEQILDSILFYVKDHNKFKFYGDTIPLSQEHIDKAYKYEDEHGRYQRCTLHGGKKGSKYAYMSFKGTPQGRGWAPPSFKKFPEWAQEKIAELKIDYNKLNQLEKLYKLDEIGMIEWSKTNTPYYKLYLKENPTMPVPNLWTDIKKVSGKAKRGYPTQKPPKLLERIIKSTTDKRDIVLDPFYGCGTTPVVAALLDRHFIGCDTSLFACATVTGDWLTENQIKWNLQGNPKDYASAKKLAELDPFKFEYWAVSACHKGLVGNANQRGDGGIDRKGQLLRKTTEGNFIIIVQVYAGTNKETAKKKLDSLALKIKNTNNVAAGIFITLNETLWTDHCKQVAYKAGTFKTSDAPTEEFPVLQHWHVRKLDNKKDFKPDLPELANPSAAGK